MNTLAAVGAVTAAAVALIVPASAPAATISIESYSGTAGSDGTVAFDTKVRNGKVRRILGSAGPPPTGMSFDNLPLTCDEGPVPLSVVIASNLALDYRRLRVLAVTTDPGDGRQAQGPQQVQRGLQLHHRQRAGAPRLRRGRNQLRFGQAHVDCGGPDRFRARAAFPGSPS
jgi:hypothetical protein